MSFLSYFRLSTQKQGVTGLDAQRVAVAAHVGGAEFVAEFTEIESCKRAGRPPLAAAIAGANEQPTARSRSTKSITPAV